MMMLIMGWQRSDFCGLMGASEGMVDVIKQANQPTNKEFSADLLNGEQLGTPEHRRCGIQSSISHVVFVTIPQHLNLQTSVSRDGARLAD